MLSECTIAVIKKCLNTDILPEINDWDTLIMEMEEQTVLPMLYAVRNDLITDEQHLTYINSYTARTISTYANILREQQRITESLDGLGIKATVIKGFSAARYYSHPELRVYGDIDLVVTNEQCFNSSVKAILELGYAPLSKEKQLTYQNCHRHYEFIKNNIEVELHKKITYSKSFLNDIVRNETPIKTKLGDHHFYCFPDLTNGLILLWHINSHFFTGIGLRQIIDWWFFVDKILSDDYWNDYFSDTASKIGLRTFAIYITRICELYFGMREHAFTQSADVKVCAEMMKNIGRSGNFGRSKDNVSKKMQSLLTSDSMHQTINNVCRSQTKELNSNSRIDSIFMKIRILFKMLSSIFKQKNGIALILKSIRDSRKLKRIKKIIYAD